MARRDGHTGVVQPVPVLAEVEPAPGPGQLAPAPSVLTAPSMLAAPELQEARDDVGELLVTSLRRPGVIANNPVLTASVDVSTPSFQLS